MQIRLLKAHEVDLHRSLRLRALQDAPDSFGETWAEAKLRPLSYWQKLTLSVTEADGHMMFLACQNNDIQGSTYGLKAFWVSLVQWAEENHFNLTKRCIAPL